jgi:predicted nucleic acid-binding protein
VIAVDTSVVVAAFASWHEAHRSAASVLGRRPRVPAHVLIETYSVLTRLPPPHRAPSEMVAAFLRTRFEEPPLALPSSAYLPLLARASEGGVVGGSLYDLLVGATAAHASARLFTRDRRGVATYELTGVDYELID